MNSPVIDIHVHFGAPKDEEGGCFWSREFTQTAAYLAMLLLTKSLFKKIDIQRVKKHMLGVINGSRFVSKCVLLAMDQVYDENGHAHPEKTHLFVPNRYLAKLSSENPRVLLGAAVHPFRNDWSEELDYCPENKAVLCKWIPSSQVINPSHQRLLPFYKKLADHSLPLLCHAGPEYAIPTSPELHNELNNPDFLRTPLDRGVTVIVAHCAMCADLSVICIPTRSEYVARVLNRVPSRGLLFGSDYPIPLAEMCYHKWKSPWSRPMFLLKMAVAENLLDKSCHLIKEMGFDENVFTNAARLFESIRY